MVASADVVIRGLAEGDEYLGDGRWGYGAFVFAPFIIGVCGFVAADALRERLTGRPPRTPPRLLWALIVAAYALLGVALIAT